LGALLGNGWVAPVLGSSLLAISYLVLTAPKADAAGEFAKVGRAEGVKAPKADAPEVLAVNTPTAHFSAALAKGRIFISYRRENDAGQAGRISDLLKREIENVSIFMDVDAVPLGIDFAEYLNEQVAKCDALLAVMGRSWLDARDEAGERRLDDPNDYVRLEIAAALRRKIPVIPILVDGTKIPKADQLPADLQQLARRNALDLRNASFDADMGKLVKQLKALG